MMKLWKGKYFDEEDLIADEFCASIGFDQRLWKEDILCGIAHVKKLAAEVCSSLHVRGSIFRRRSR